MFETFGESHYIACSFQKTSSVTAHLASKVNPNARFFYLDTDVLFPETYETRNSHSGSARSSNRSFSTPATDWHATRGRACIMSSWVDGGCGSRT